MIRPSSIRKTAFAATAGAVGILAVTSVWSSCTPTGGKSGSRGGDTGAADTMRQEAGGAASQGSYNGGYSGGGGSASAPDNQDLSGQITALAGEQAADGVGTPATTAPEAPGGGYTEAPATTGAGMPATTEPEAPGGGYTEAPATTGAGMPATTEPEAPGGGYTEAPATTGAGTPVATYPEAPGGGYTEAPATTGAGMPANTEPEAPGGGYTEAPATIDTGTPATTEPEPPGGGYTEAPATTDPEAQIGGSAAMPATTGPEAQAGANNGSPKASCDALRAQVETAHQALLAAAANYQQAVNNAQAQLADIRFAAQLALNNLAQQGGKVDSVTQRSTQTYYQQEIADGLAEVERVRASMPSFIQPPAAQEQSLRDQLKACGGQ